MNPFDRDQQALLAELSARGVATSSELQAALGKSQPTLSRLLAALSSQVLTVGRGRKTRYAIARPIFGQPAQQPLWWIDDAGMPRRLGTLSLLGDGSVVHVAGAGFDDIVRDRLPWYLAPLKPQGFLGRLLAQRLAPSGLASNPESWGVEMSLFAALQLHDAPGAIVLGEPAAPAAHHPIPLDAKDAGTALDELAADVARTLPAGSSAGGEQPKFLALLESGEHVIVKFTPLRGTPFGERWHELLHAEAVAAEVLARHGVAVAAGRIVETARRSYLLSPRFDRVGANGRRHAVAVGAVHQAFVAGPYANWAGTCEALARQGRLDRIGGDQARALLEFGRLIGNSDMHSGNLSLMVELDGLAAGRFALAPVYDMLPMRWRPDPVMGGAADYTPFEPDPVCLVGPSRAPAHEFWSELARRQGAGKELRQVASEMARRLS
ncbi:MAG TPA: HipA domain-containing protein [Albitalea sp.]|nr:HipA domain-containing protein [Albitalea sp.]